MVGELRMVQKEVYAFSDEEFRRQLSGVTSLSKEDVKATSLLRINTEDVEKLLTEQGIEGEVKKAMLELHDEGVTVMTMRHGQMFGVRAPDLFAGIKQVGFTKPDGRKRNKKTYV